MTMYMLVLDADLVYTDGIGQVLIAWVFSLINKH